MTPGGRRGGEEEAWRERRPSRSTQMASIIVVADRDAGDATGFLVE
jgi:hypothetical protein